MWFCQSQQSRSNCIQVGCSPAPSTPYTVTLPQLRHPLTSVSSFMDEGKMLLVNMSNVKFILMGRQNQTENVAAPVKFPYVHSQLELRSLPGLLIHIFSKQALATRYFPALEDVRSALPYLKLVHKSVWYLRPGSRQLVGADTEGCMTSSANLPNLSSAVWTGFSESAVMSTRSCPKFSQWLGLRMSEILFPASAQILQATTCLELGMIPLHRYIFSM